VTRLQHTPALNGVRGIAVAAVLLFHTGVGRGGHLGVTVFFALSGFLITSLLLAEKESTGRVALRAFWARRAKRLVPALLVTLGFVAAVAAWTTNPARTALGDSVATLTWSTNWWFLWHGTSYADVFSDPSPLQHAWSLAVEEQYYLVFPLLFLLLARGGRRALAIGLALLGIASVATGALLVEAGADSSRLHFGTDTRGAEIVAGALLAVALQRGDAWRRLPRVAAPVGLVAAIGVLWAFVAEEDDSRFLHRGGWALVAVATCAVIATAVQPGSAASRVLGVRPLVWLGEVSYGAYLYHWPVYLLVDDESTGLTGAWLVLTRLAVVLVLAEISLAVVELPVRLSQMSLPVGTSSWALAGGAGLLAVAFATGAVSLPGPPPLPAATTQAVAPAVPQQPPQQQAPVPQSQQQGQPRQQAQARHPAVAVTRQPSTVKRSVRREAVPYAFTRDPDRVPVPPVPQAKEGQLKVAVLGDSLGDNLGRGLSVWSHERSDVVVYDLALPACPLSLGGERRAKAERPFPLKRACHWWDDDSNARRQALDAFAPDVVVLEDGVNELFDRRLSTWSDWRSPGQLSYDNWLVDQYASLRSTLGHAKVLMVNTPCADWERYEVFHQMANVPQRVSAINTDQQRVTGINRADLSARICPNGQYSDTVEGVPNGRPDGLHLSDEAATELARNWLGPLVTQAGVLPGVG
jgi:peptidoglycan/LPS O-acetylase OafA/YrhL